ncbi:hypothetical protein [Paenibacillus pedocola]|uniref:hypothetical protein n=1 Tax=Paenibacillus pedocola TaxID=3242193 RepID=UPI002877336F|nr:hypothetical protein [Paenibacillus typhae]
MKTLAPADLKVIKNWMYRNARPLDLARWKFHFEAGGVEAVLEALAAYQNEDGGFGHALEADAWNPHSSPIQTATAVERLLEVHFQDNSHPAVQGILKYLDSGAEMDGNTWMNVVASFNDYPHAPWWHTTSSSTARSIFNPTAILAGFILRFADRDSRLYERGLGIAKELEELFLQDPHIEMHPLLCVVKLLECIGEAGVREQFAYTELNAAAGKRITELLERNASDWSGYSCKPSFFIKTRESLGFTDNAVLLKKELDYTLDIRNQEGVWDLTWSWDGFEQAFAISENWWKASIVIEKLLFLRAFGRLG